MKTITIQVPDGCEVQIVRKEEKKESVIRTYQDLINAEKSIKGHYLGTNGGLISYATTASEFCTNVAKEYILCAAVKRLKRRESCGNPYYKGTNDILDIELGYRHHDIYQRFIDEMNITPNAQGFYTSKGRFVGREEAYKIALEAGQIKEENRAFPNIKLLCSEDLY